MYGGPGVIETHFAGWKRELFFLLSNTHSLYKENVFCYMFFRISGQNANDKIPLPETLIPKMLASTPKLQPPNPKNISQWKYLGVLSLAFRLDTVLLCIHIWMLQAMACYRQWPQGSALNKTYTMLKFCASGQISRHGYVLRKTYLQSKPRQAGNHKCCPM